ncbi:hypothetical protein DASC09_039710 [Saccharomycopsis crataegensis]|uniref:Mitochondrial group I intron splicing factor CCM1 n=1 Tax=Saccharomycopsis crataegensis TaxID=43959 RepID=A0AAV5QPZ8_9ASCO|nr:hypothetical protein DASC09_039710 [Saccharomycopsis crataegensis]
MTGCSPTRAWRRGFSTFSRPANLISSQRHQSQWQRQEKQIQFIRRISGNSSSMIQGVQNPSVADDNRPKLLENATCSINRPTVDDYFRQLTALIETSLESSSVDISKSEFFKYSQVLVTPKLHEDDYPYREFVDQRHLYKSFIPIENQKNSQHYQYLQHQWNLSLKLSKFFTSLTTKHSFLFDSDKSLIDCYTEYLKSLKFAPSKSTSNSIEAPTRDIDEYITGLIGFLSLQTNRSDTIKVLMISELKHAATRANNNDVTLFRTMMVNLIGSGTIDHKSLVAYIKLISADFKNHDEISEMKNREDFHEHLVDSVTEHNEMYQKFSSSNNKDRSKILAIAALLDKLHSLEPPIRSVELKGFMKNLVVHVTIDQKKLLLGTSMCLNDDFAGNSNMTKDFPILKQTISILIDSLAIVNPLFDELQIDAIMKLLIKYQPHHYKLSTYQAIKIYEKVMACDDENFPIIGNRMLVFLDHCINNGNDAISDDRGFYDLYRANDLTASDLEQQYRRMDIDTFIRLSKLLIMKNIKSNNPAGVYLIHSTLTKYNPNWILEDLGMFCSLILIFRKNRNFENIGKQLMYQVLDHENRDWFLKNEKLLSTLIDMASKSKDFAAMKILMTKISNPPMRSVLSSLVKFYLGVNDAASVSKVLGRINDSRIEFSASEFNELVRALLKTGDSTHGSINLKEHKVYQLISSQKPSRAIYAYISYLNWMVDKSYLSKSNGSLRLNLPIAVEFIENLYQCYYSGAIRFEDKKQLDFLSMLYLKYVVKEYGVEMAAKVYRGSVLGFDGDINDLDEVPFFYKTELDHRSSNNKKGTIVGNYMNNLTNSQQLARSGGGGGGIDQDFGYNFMVVPFGMEVSETKDLKLYIPTRIKVIALKMIADRARAMEDRMMSKWCIHELVECGSSGLEILIDFSKKYRKELRRIGIEVPTATIVNEEKSISKRANTKRIQPGIDELKQFWKAQGDEFYKYNLGKIGSIMDKSKS